MQDRTDIPQTAAPIPRRTVTTALAGAALAAPGAPDTTATSGTKKSSKVIDFEDEVVEVAQA